MNFTARAVCVRVAAAPPDSVRKKDWVRARVLVLFCSMAFTPSDHGSYEMAEEIKLLLLLLPKIFNFCLIVTNFVHDLFFMFLKNLNFKSEHFLDTSLSLVYGFQWRYFGFSRALDWTAYLPKWLFEEKRVESLNKNQ